MEGVADGTLEGDAMSASRSQSSEIGGCVCGGGSDPQSERLWIHRTGRCTQIHADAAKNHRCTFRWIDRDRDTETQTQR